MQIGYARASTADQTLALQQDALTAAGCDQIFTEEGISGSVTTRRGLDRALGTLASGDTLVVWKLDRLGRSLSHLVNLIAELGAKGVSFRSLSDPIDTTRLPSTENSQHQSDGTVRRRRLGDWLDDQNGGSTIKGRKISNELEAQGQILGWLNTE